MMLISTFTTYANWQLRDGDRQTHRTADCSDPGPGRCIFAINNSPGMKENLVNSDATCDDPLNFNVIGTEKTNFYKRLSLITAMDHVYVLNIKNSRLFHSCAILTTIIIVVMSLESARQFLADIKVGKVDLDLKELEDLEHHSERVSHILSKG